MKKSRRVYAVFLALMSVPLLVVVDVGCKPEVPPPSIGVTDVNLFELISFTLDGKDGVANEQLEFTPNQEVEVKASYKAINGAEFSDSAVFLTFVTKAEMNRVIDASCLFSSNVRGSAQTSGNVRTVSGTLKMSPEHMVGFMQKYTTEEFFDCVLKDGDYVVAHCRIVLKE